MFDIICIRRQSLLDAPQPLDMAFLAEALLYYQDVQLIADRDILVQIAETLGPHVLEALLKEGFLRISYLEKVTGVRNYDVGSPRETHVPVAAWPTNGDWRLEKLAPELFSKTASGPGFGRQFGRWFAGQVPTVDLGDDLLSAVRQDFSDSRYCADAVERILAVLAPTYRLPQGYRFDVFREGDRFRIESNVDFQQANNSFNARAGTTGETLSASALLVYLLEARSDLYFSSREDAELATSQSNSAAIGVKLSEVLSVRAESQRQVEIFQEIELSNAHEVGETITQGHRTWMEFVELLREARRFKEWMQKAPADGSLLREYNKALEADTWLGKTPVKSLRYLLFTGAGLLASPPASVGLGAFDAFVLDQLLGGWKPNQFVNGPLKRFLRLNRP